MRGRRFISLLSPLGVVGIPAWAAPGSLFGLDFANSRYWPQPLASQTTFSRASVGEADNLSGVWSQFLSGIARINNKGLRYEPASTNFVRNPKMIGAAVGAPGTPPTNMGITQPGSGVSASITAIGNLNGVDYVDILVSGTASATIPASTALLTFDTTTGIPALSGQTWTLAPFLSIPAGTLPASSMMLDPCERTSAGVLVKSNGVVVAPSATFARVPTTVALSGGATTACLQPELRWGVPSGTVVNFTLRVGWPGIELGASATSPMVPTGTGTSAPTARLADSLTINRTGIGRVVFTFDDASQQTISGINTAAQYTLPTTLNRQVIARMDGYAS